MVNVWIDLTNSPHVLVMAPVIATLHERGHRVSVTARDFAQTLELCRRLEVAHTAIGRHRGAGMIAKARGLGARSRALAHWAHGQGFDRAIGHGSNDVMVAARLLRIPATTAFDYEWAAIQHAINCPLADTVVVPDAIAPERLYRYGARGKVRRYPGLKEEYYLAGFQPDPAVLGELSLKADQPLVVVRTPPEVSLYHRFANSLFEQVLDGLRGSQTVVLPRTAHQRARLLAAGGFIVPEHAIDAQSLVAYADLVVSAGGTMNREAVALGAPVLTVFEGRLGAVDERLIAQGRLRRLQDVAQLEIAKRPRGRGSDARVRRDPAVLTDLLLGG